MRYALISDLHSNLEALEAFLVSADEFGVDSLVSLGDIVGYNADPNACIALLRERKVRSILGNHDSRAIGLDDPNDFTPLALEAILWTKERLTEENKEYLKALPRTLLVDERFLAVHGSVDDTDSYIRTLSDAERNFELLKAYPKARVCFYGHTHEAAAYVMEDGVISRYSGRKIPVKKGCRYLINPGALGQPRDKDPRASFLIYDTKKAMVEFHRIEYDVDATASKIVEAGLPPRLAGRLKLGW